MGILLNQNTYSENVSQFPGYYEVKKMELISTYGDVHDISFFFSELNIYEDVNSPTLTGSIVLTDTTNLIKNVPIIGEETLVLEISDQYADFKKEFYVYKIADRQQINFGMLAYTLHFCSKEMYVNSYARVSKAYQRTPYEDAVLDVLYTYLNSNTALRSAPTKFPQSFILPNWSPLFAVKWMASRSQDQEYVGGNYLFYEDLDQFNFVAVENLLDSDKNKPFAEISFDPLRPTEQHRAAYDSRQRTDVMRFESMEVTKSLDVLENMTFGMYKNMVRVIDVAVRGSDTTTYDYHTEFTNSEHLKGFLGESHPLASDRQLNVAYDIQMENNVFVKSKGLFSDEPDGGFQVEDWYSPRLSQMLQLNNFVIQGTLPGQLELRAGMQVRFKMPNVENLDVARPIEPDIAYSGNYLITSIRRMFQKNKFYCVVEMIKDNMSIDRDGLRI